MNFIKNNSTKIAYWLFSLFAVVYAFRFGFITGSLSDEDGVFLALLLSFGYFFGYILLNQYFRNLIKGKNKNVFFIAAAVILAICNAISFVQILSLLNEYKMAGQIGLGIFDTIFTLAQTSIFVLIIFNKINNNSFINILKLALLVVSLLAFVTGIIVLFDLIEVLKYVPSEYKFYEIIMDLPIILSVFLYGSLFIFYSYSSEA